MHPRVLGEERLNPRGLVRREVIGDHVNLFAFGLVGHDVGQECDELGRGVARCSLAQHTSPVLVLNAAYRERVP